MWSLVRVSSAQQWWQSTQAQDPGGLKSEQASELGTWFSESRGTVEESRSVKKVLGHSGRPQGSTGLGFGGIERDAGLSPSFQDAPQWHGHT